MLQVNLSSPRGLIQMREGGGERRASRKA